MDKSKASLEAKMSWIGVRAAAAAGGGPMVAIAFVNAVMALVNASV